MKDVTLTVQSSSGDRTPLNCSYPSERLDEAPVTVPAGFLTNLLRAAGTIHSNTDMVVGERRLRSLYRVYLRNGRVAQVVATRYSEIEGAGLPLIRFWDDPLQVADFPVEAVYGVSLAQTMKEFRDDILDPRKQYI